MALTTEEIKIILLRKKVSIAGLAREFGCHRTELSRIINRHQEAAKSPEIRERLAGFLGVDPASLPKPDQRGTMAA